jgi:branched-chain amino acid aminotransferase
MTDMVITAGPAAEPTSGTGRPQWIWRSGTLLPWADARIHVNAVGHASASAIFEGIRAYRAAAGDRLLIFRLADHLRRLLDSARICRLDLGCDEGELTAAVIEVLRANAYRHDTYIRPWAFPAGFITEQMVPADTRCEVVIDTWPAGSELSSHGGCRASVSSWLRVGDASMPPRVKAFANYHNGRLALMEARENGHDWPILLNGRHQVSEGPGACVALVRNGHVATPSLSSGVLESITRATAIDLLRDEFGIPVEERDVDRTELYLADELFFLGTAWEVKPITAVDGIAVGDGVVGPVTAGLRAAYARVVRGESDRYRPWLTELAW